MQTKSLGSRLYDHFILTLKRWRLWLSIVTASLVMSCSPAQIATAIQEYSFKCTEVGTSSSVGPYTKLSGLAFNLDVVTLKNGAETSLDASYASYITTTLEMVATTDNASCESGAAAITDASVYSVPFSTTGRSTISGITVSNAYKNLMCRVNIVYNGTTYRKCGGVTYAVRPAYLTVTSTNANAHAAGTSTTATPFIAASSQGSAASSSALFNLTVTARNNLGNTTSNFNGTPVISSSSVAAHSGAIRTGSLAPTSFAAATSGVSTGNFSYSEVGYFKLNAGGVTESTYTATDNSNGRCIAGSSSNTLSGGKYGCNVSTISDTSFFGRFVPFTFQTQPISAGTTQSCTAGTNAFSYYGSDFSTTFRINALAEGGAITQNYNGSFAKFAQGSVGTTYANYVFALSPSVSGVTLQQGSQSPQFVTGNGWASGTAQVKAVHKTTRNTTLTNPQSLSVTAKPTDGEVVSGTATTLSSAPLTMRYGRLKFYNAYGAETMPLRVKAYAQYWDGSKWVVNTDDSCSTLNTDSIYLKFPVDARNNLSQCETILTPVTAGGTFDRGIVTYQFTAPGQGNNGWLEMSVRYSLTGALDELFCTLAGVPTPLLVSGLTQFLDTVLGNDSVKATVSFGQYKSTTIYNRER